MDRVFMSYGKVLTGCCVVTSSEGCRRPGLFLSFHHPQTHEQVLNNSVAFRVCPALLCCAEKEKYSIPSATGSRLVLLLPGDMAQQGLSSSMHKYSPLAIAHWHPSSSLSHTHAKRRGGEILNKLKEEEGTDRGAASRALLRRAPLPGLRLLRRRHRRRRQGEELPYQQRVGQGVHRGHVQAGELPGARLADAPSDPDQDPRRGVAGGPPPFVIQHAAAATQG